MKFSELLAFIPEEELDFLSVETKVDLQVKKLKGIVMFKLLLYSLLESSKPSLRVMENYFNSSKFKFLANTAGINTKYNSIGDRLSTINSDYFEKIFNHLFEKYKDNAHYKAELKRKIDDDKVEYLDLEKMSADQLKERREEEKSQKLALLKYQQVLTFFQYLIAFVVGIIFYRKFSE
jgi:hypothetical protein